MGNFGPAFFAGNRARFRSLIGNDTPIIRFYNPSPRPGVGQTIIGNAGNFPIQRYQTDKQFVYNLTTLFGSHYFKAGTDIRRERLDDLADNFSRGFYSQLTGRSLLMGFYTTVGCLILGYPLAYRIATASDRVKALLIAGVLIPFWTNLLVRTYGWMVMLNPKGIIFSGGPASVTEHESPRAPQVLFDSGLPLLAICYGQQTLHQQLGEHSLYTEFGAVVGTADGDDLGLVLSLGTGDSVRVQAVPDGRSHLLSPRVPTAGLPQTGLSPVVPAPEPGRTRSTWGNAGRSPGLGWPGEQALPDRRVRRLHGCVRALADRHQGLPGVLGRPAGGGPGTGLPRRLDGRGGPGRRGGALRVPDDHRRVTG